MSICHRNFLYDKNFTLNSVVLCVDKSISLPLFVWFFFLILSYSIFELYQFNLILNLPVVELLV